jgi:biotin operon repressor
MPDTPASRSEQVHTNASGTAFVRDMFQWLRQVAADQGLPPLSARVAIVVSQYINRKTGTAWPTQETLANRLGVSRRAINRNIKALAARGHLNVTATRGRHKPNIYRLALKNETSPSHIQPNKCASGVTLSKSENVTPVPINETHEANNCDACGSQNHLSQPIEEPSEREPTRSNLEFLGCSKKERTRRPALTYLSPDARMTAADTDLAEPYIQDPKNNWPDYEEIYREWMKFRSYYVSKGEPRADWGETWHLWLVRRAEHKKQNGFRGRRLRTSDIV